jgi:hypothetical protein
MSKSKIKMSSNRNFGLVFSVFFLILGFWPLVYGENLRIWFIIISIVFLILGLVKSKILTPLNIIWYKLGLILGVIVAPVVMGIVFFLVVTPIGLFMKLIGKDLLNKKFNNNIKTYWIKRVEKFTTMKRQF